MPTTNALFPSPIRELAATWGLCPRKENHATTKTKQGAHPQRQHHSFTPQQRRTVLSLKWAFFPHTRLFTLNEQQRQRHPLAAAPSLLTSPTPSNSSVRVAFYPPRAHKGACGWRSWARTTHPGVCCVPASTAPLGGVCAWARAGVFFVGARARAVHRSHSWGRVRAPPVCFCCSSRVLERERSD